MTPADRETATRILRLRMAAGVTPRTLSRMAKLPGTAVSEIERGERAATPDEVTALARALGVDRSDLAPEVAA